MTFFGKILVVLNLALSLAFATWALAAYTNRIDWQDRKKDAADERTWGRIAVLKEDINRLTGAGDKLGPRGLAEVRWLTAVGQLRAAEAERRDHQQWYAEQLEVLHTGQTAKKAPVAEPVKRVAFKGGELQMEKGLPKLEVVADKAGAPVRHRAALAQQQTELNADVAKVQEEIRTLTAEAAKLTDRVRELFTQIERAAAVRHGAGEEQRYLEQILYNVQVEAELLLDRQKALEARLNELKSTRVTSQDAPK